MLFFKTFSFFTIFLIACSGSPTTFPTSPVPLSLIDIDMDFDFPQNTPDPINVVDLQCEEWPQGIDCINKQQMMSLYNVDVFDDQPHSFANLPIVSILSHESSIFDTNQLSFPAARRLLSFSIQAAIPRIGIISTQREFGIGEHVFEQKHVNFVVESKGGQHSLQFSQTDRFLISGGNLSLCLCEFLRDAIHGTALVPKQTPQKPVDFVFITDGVYDDSTFWPSVLPSRLTQDDLGQIEDGEPVPFLLTSLIESAGTNRNIFLDYLSKNVLGLGSDFCPGQNSANHPPIDSRELTWNIYLNDSGKVQKLKTFGNKGRQINFIFAPSQELISTLTYLSR